MKKSLLLLCIISSTIGLCQEKTSDKLHETSIFDRKHEIKIGALKLLVGPIFEGTYEYIHSKNFTYGSSILINLDLNSNFQEDFSITPFARFYFQETKEFGAYGFYVEGFAKYYNGRYNSLFSSNNKKYNAAALGMSVGRKWINTSGFVLETLLGLGRTIGGGTDAPDLILRGDVSIGYRF